MISDGNKLTELWFDNHKHFMGKKAPLRAMPIFDETKAWLNDYFSGSCPAYIPPISVQGTKFQKQVWKLLMDIPYGHVVTYKQLAGQISSTMSSQAVGQAVGHNPVSLIIPCHRVIGSNGKLTGYASGLEIKKALLRLEGYNENIDAGK